MHRRALPVVVVGVALAAATATGFLLFRQGGRTPATDVSGREVGAPQPADAAATGTIRIPLTDRAPARLPVEGVPAGWTLKEFAGRADVGLVQDDAVALRLRSHRASYVLYRDLVVDLQSHPWLSWSWKVVQLPEGGDLRSDPSDDQAAQLYVVFPRWPAPRARSDVIGYVWDTTAPVGTQLPSPRAPNVRLIVVASGPGRRGQWQRFERNVATDYVALFGREPARTGKIALMIDSNDTRSDAEALVADLRFAGAPTEKVEIPTSMLR